MSKRNFYFGMEGVCNLLLHKWHGSEALIEVPSEARWQSGGKIC